MRPAESSDSIPALVTSARNGDREAFGRLYQVYGRMVHGVLLARMPTGEVEDLVQEVFLKALRQIHTLRDPNAFGGWIAMIARHAAISRRAPALVGWAMISRRRSRIPTARRVLRLMTRGCPRPIASARAPRRGMTGPEIAGAPADGRLGAGQPHRGFAMLKERLTGGER